MEWFNIEAARAADAAFSSQMFGTGGVIYLWHKRGGLTFAAEKPGPEWELTSPIAQRGFLTREQLRRWTYDIARRAPCLPLE